MNTIQAPVIIPINHPSPSDNGSWRAHAMHCPECKKIWDEEHSFGNFISNFAAAILLVGVLLALVWGAFRLTFGRNF